MKKKAGNPMRTIEEIKKKIPNLSKSYIESIDSYAWIGIYHDPVDNKLYFVIFGENEDGYEHLSVTPHGHSKLPTWELLCRLKDIFWQDEEECYQVFPKKSEYVNIHEKCMHIWRNIK